MGWRQYAGKAVEDAEKNASLKARAEAGEPEAQKELSERRQYQVRATVKSYQKMRDDALKGDSVAKER